MALKISLVGHDKIRTMPAKCILTPLVKLSQWENSPKKQSGVRFC